MWHCFVTDSSKEQAGPNEYPSGATNAGISLFSREAVGLRSFCYRANQAEEGPQGEVWQFFLGHLAGENELWRCMGFDDDPRSILTTSELWPAISPSTSVSSSVGWRPHTSPSEDRMKSREKIITSMATHKKSLGSVSPSLASVLGAEENGTLQKNMLTFHRSSASNFRSFDKSKGDRHIPKR